MKKLLRIVVIAVVISAAIWSTLWFAGRTQVEARLEAEAARLRGQGYEIDYGPHEIGGFPFRYAITYHDVTVRYPVGPHGLRASYVLPSITAEMRAADVDRIVFRLPEKFRFELPVDPAARAEAPGLPEQFDVDVEAEDCVVTLGGVLSGERDVTVAAKALLIATGKPEQDLKLAFDLSGLKAQATLPPPGRPGKVPSQTEIERVDYGLAVSKAGSTPVILQGSLDKVRVTGTTDMYDPKEAAEKMLSGEMNSTAAFQTGASEGVLTIPEGAGQWSGSVRFSAASTAGTAGMESGVIRFETSGQANHVALVPAAAGGQGPGLGAAISSLELAYALPIAPSQELEPVGFRLALDQVAPDEAVWDLIDPDGALPHDPARLVLDLDATARMTGRLDQTAPGQGLPVELGKATIRAAELSALGAGLRAEGGVEFLPVLQIPVGKITVTLTDAFQMLNKLVKAGLLPPEKAQAAIAAATGFTTEGAAPGERVSVIELTPAGILVNGARLQ